MKKAIYLTLLIGLWPAFVAFRPLYNPPRPTPPNVVLIFMDDLGFGDLGCYGATGYQTPHLDRLASEGIRFTNFLSAQPVCTASRAALLTGCYPNRIGLYGALFPGSKIGINSEETTLAELLKSQGYATAIFGKWHLGDQRPFLPLNHGFDEYVGLPYSNDMWPVDYDGKPVSATSSPKARFTDLPLLRGKGDTLRLIRTLDDQAELTGLLTMQAVDFIKRNRKKPFFLYLAHPMPHVPIAASARFRGRTERGLFGDVITEIDHSVGEVLAALKANKLDKNTLVVFTSDNGPWYNFGNHAGSTSGLREGKGTTYEGGNRIPCLVRWPGVIPAGLVCNALASTIDLLPTIAGRCGAPLPSRKLDGVDLWPLWQGDLTASPRKEFYYYYRKNNLEAVRRGNWKLVLPHPGRTYGAFPVGQNGFPGKTNENNPETLALYDLSRDPGERYDLKDQFPERVAELQQIATAARLDLGDDLTAQKGANTRPAGELP
ncbi:sulfatase [Spirosoma montaniterrae]|uniref:Arylsulfatase n=1 Tax=Spirosoma montaniterrae TaxID=1178516 RepID=A0A1P9X2W7_9BACT|nr:sulfatase [Spirosoma montaniterrae]AQG81974.1 arylsulfatase [Spirosoma montaniterrae]